MNKLPYPQALLDITPKMVLAALRSLKFPALSERECETAELFHQIGRAHGSIWYLRVRNVESPMGWSKVCALWNSKRFATVRGAYDPEQPDSPANQEPLATLASALMLHLSNPYSPLNRFGRIAQLRGVARSPADQRAYERRLQRDASTNRALTLLLASATRDGDVVTLDASLLFGELLDSRAHSWIALGLEGRVMYIQTKRLRAVATAVRGYQNLTASVECHPSLAQLHIRWERDGRRGGLSFVSDPSGASEAGTDALLSIVFSEAAPFAPAPDVTVPEWATIAYQNKVLEAMAKREREAKLRRDEDAAQVAVAAKIKRIRKSMDAAEKAFVRRADRKPAADTQPVATGPASSNPTVSRTATAWVEYKAIRPDIEALEADIEAGAVVSVEVRELLAQARATVRTNWGPRLRLWKKALEAVGAARLAA